MGTAMLATTKRIRLEPGVVEKLSELTNAQIAEDFRAFRRAIRPTMVENWWTELIGCMLQRFYDDLVAGKRPKMAIMAPPQHGKSWAAQDFIAWLSGRSPQLKSIFASYSDELGMSTNLYLQRVWQSEAFKRLFPHLQVGDHAWVCNTNLIEFPYFTGSFRNTTVKSGINGLELHLGVIDDPHKGRAEALSITERNKVWNWFADDWMARFHKNSGMLIIQTRWHVDDLLGRYLQREQEVMVVQFPAVAEYDETFRRRGEALFPEVKPLDFLMERRKLMTEASWQSEYQQHPIIVGGGIFPIEKLTTITIFNKDMVNKSIRYVDKAGTEDGGAYTAMVLMHQLKDGRFVISHVVRGQWGALEREQRLKALAQLDTERYGYNYEIWVEQEPGSGGKESAEATIRNLAGMLAYADKVTGSKEVRAEPFAAQVQNNNVRLVAAEWNYPFLDEAEAWPNGRYRDQIDAAAGAFAKLTGGPLYDHSYSGF